MLTYYNIYVMLILSFLNQQKKESAMEYTKNCSVCGSEFTTVYCRQNVCGFKCKIEKNRNNSRKSMRLKRSRQLGTIKCQVCNWEYSTERHHDGPGVYQLCPNHHSLITRGIKTIEDYGISPIDSDLHNI